MWPSARTAPSSWPTGSIRSSAAIRCRTAAATAASIASRPRDRKLTTPAVDLTTTDGQIQALLSPAINVRGGGLRAAEGRRRRGAAGGEEDARRLQSVPSGARDLAARRARAVRRSRGRAAARPIPIRRSASPRSARCASVKPSVLSEARRLADDPSVRCAVKWRWRCAACRSTQSRGTPDGAGCRLSTARIAGIWRRSARRRPAMRAELYTRAAVVAARPAIHSTGTGASPPSPGGCIRWRHRRVCRSRGFVCSCRPRRGSRPGRARLHQRPARRTGDGRRSLAARSATWRRRRHGG